MLNVLFGRKKEKENNCMLQVFGKKTSLID